MQQPNQLNLADIKASVSKYTAVAFYALISGKTILEVTIDDALSNVFVELTAQGLDIDFKAGLNLKPLFDDMQQQVIRCHEKSPRDGFGAAFSIEHQNVFRVFYLLGFDGRDVFDCYEAARLRKAFTSDASSDEARAAYQSYKVLSIIIKEFQEVKSRLSEMAQTFELTQAGTGTDLLEKLTQKTQSFWAIITKEIVDYATVTDALKIINHNFKTEVIATIDEAMQTQTLSQAKEKTSLCQIAKLLSDAKLLCGTYVSLLKDPAFCDMAASSRAENLDCSIKAMEETSFKTSDLSLTITMSPRVGKIKPNPVTGNTQFGSVLSLNCTELKRDSGVHLVCIVDVSGSMSGSRIHTVNALLNAAKNKLQDGDKFTLISFNTEATLLRSEKVDAQSKDPAPIALVAGGGTELSSVTRLIKTTVWGGADDRQVVVNLFSDGDVASKDFSPYKGNRGSAMSLRDVIIDKWELNQRNSRFISVAVGAHTSPEGVSAFADDDELIIIPDNPSSECFDAVKAEYLAKCDHFKRVSLSGSLLSNHKNQGGLEVTGGRSLEALYLARLNPLVLEHIDTVPADVINLIIMPYLFSPHFRTVSKGDSFQIVQKFVAQEISRPLHLRVAFFQENSGRCQTIVTQVPSENIDEGLDDQIASHEKSVALLANGSGASASALTQAYRARGGRSSAVVVSSVDESMAFSPLMSRGRGG